MCYQFMHHQHFLYAQGYVANKTFHRTTDVQGSTKVLSLLSKIKETPISHEIFFWKSCISSQKQGFLGLNKFLSQKQKCFCLKNNFRTETSLLRRKKKCHKKNPQKKIRSEKKNSITEKFVFQLFVKETHFGHSFLH